MTAVLRWEKPPATGRYPLGRGKSRWAKVADDLRTRPGEWALIAEGPVAENSGLATQIRMGQMVCFSPAGDFDAETQRKNGVRKVWATYVGDGA
jgi:hypothetical protein